MDSELLDSILVVQQKRYLAGNARNDLQNRLVHAQTHPHCYGAEGDETHQLNGVIEFDDSYFGGPTAGKKRSRDTEKAKVFAALSLDELGNPRFLKMRVTPNLKQASVKKFAHAAFADSSVIHSDGYRSYIPALEGFTHEHRSYIPDSGLLHWLHIVISNAKAFIPGTYHGLPKKHLQSYLDEYSFRFSRRGLGRALVERLSLSIALSRSAEQKE